MRDYTQSIELLLGLGLEIVNWNGDRLSVSADPEFEVEINYSFKPTKKYKNTKRAIRYFLNQNI